MAITSRVNYSICQHSIHLLHVLSANLQAREASCAFLPPEPGCSRRVDALPASRRAEEATGEDGGGKR